MAYVPSFEHDIFISYAHADDDVATGTTRVTDFHRDLVSRLKIRLGARAFHKPEEWVFFDRTGLNAGDQLNPRLERAARRSAIMISLLSPSYLQADWCIREVEWFLEGRRMARDRIERMLIPVVVNPVGEDDLSQFPQFAHRLRASLCPHLPGSIEWTRFLDNLANQVTTHLNAARKRHGAVYVGEAYSAAQDLRAELVEELRGFRCIPENAIFAQKDAVSASLAEAKLAVHFLGYPATEAANSVDAIDWSLELCKGKTVGYLPPDRQLAPDERGLVDHIRNHPKWTQLQSTPTELAQILTRELEGCRLPDPARPIALACDEPDLVTVFAIASEIHQRDGDAFAVGTPDFLADAAALPFSGWRKLLTKSQGVIVYWGRGQKDYLVKNIVPFLPAAKLGRAWYVSLSGADTELKRAWPPPDPETEIIVDEEQPFRYELLEAFLKRVRERARQ